MEDALEELKRKKLEELQQSQLQETQKIQQQVEQLESFVKQAFTKEALQRYGTLKIAHPDKAVQLLVILAQAIQNGQITKIDDEQLKQILKKLTPKKRDFKIRRI
jgi:programmed cell death protein 5